MALGSTEQQLTYTALKSSEGTGSILFQAKETLFEPENYRHVGETAPHKTWGLPPLANYHGPPPSPSPKGDFDFTTHPSLADCAHL